MSTRGTKECRKLLRMIVADNQKKGRLRGGLDQRSSAVRAAQNLLALMQLHAGRTFDAGNDPLKRLIADLRLIAADRRMSATGRIIAARRLVSIEGYLSIDALGDEPTDTLIRTLVVNPIMEHETQATEEPVVAGESLGAMLKRLRGGNDVTTDSSG